MYNVLLFYYLLINAIYYSIILLLNLQKIKRRQEAGRLIKEIVDKNHMHLALYHWFFQMHWRKIEHKMYLPPNQLNTLVLLMRSFPMKKVSLQYISLCRMVEKHCPSLTLKPIEELQDFSKASTIKRILKEVLAIFPRIDKFRSRCKSALKKKQTIIGLLSISRRKTMHLEINTMVKMIKIVNRIEYLFQLMYLKHLHPIYVMLQREDGDSRELQRAKTDRMEKLALIWIALEKNIILKQFNFYIKTIKKKPIYEKECDGIGLLEKTNETIVLEVKTSWDAVALSMDRKNALDIQLKTIEEFGFSKSAGVIVGNKNPDWLTYNGQRIVCTSLTTYLAAKVDRPGYASQMSDILNDMRNSTIAAEKKVEWMKNDNRVNIVEQEILEKLSDIIVDMYQERDRKYSENSVQSRINKYCNIIFTLPVETWKL